MRVVPRRTVVGDIDRRFDSLSGSHHQSHVNCVPSAYGIYVSGQLSSDVIGCFKSNRWLSRKACVQVSSCLANVRCGAVAAFDLVYRCLAFGSTLSLTLISSCRKVVIGL